MEFLRYACIRLLGVGFTDGFLTFSCRSYRRRLVAYWAVADGLRLFLVGEYELGCTKDMGSICVVVRRDCVEARTHRRGYLKKSVNSVLTSAAAAQSRT